MKRIAMIAVLVLGLFSWVGKVKADSLLSGVNFLGVTYQGSNGEYLFPGQILMSMSGYYRVIMQFDGNLVVYGGGIDGGEVIWASNTVGVGGYAVLQSDCNLVIRNWNDEPVWSTGTWHKVVWEERCDLQIQNDGNLVLYQSVCGQYYNNPLWASYGNYGPVKSAPMPTRDRISQTRKLVNYGIPGNDLVHLQTDVARSSQCGYYCMVYRQYLGVPCASYTYVPPNAQGELASCWLKGEWNSAQNPPVYAVGMVTGYMNFPPEEWP